MIDFAVIASAALGRAESLIPTWLPAGRWQGDEWVSRNPVRNDAHPGSFKINRKTFAWADFATGDKGGDAISLFAYLHGGLKQGEAAHQLAGELGLSANGNGLTAAAGKSGLTLKEFADAKGFDVNFLTAHGVTEEREGIIFHHFLMNGQRAQRHKLRKSLSHDRDNWSFWTGEKKSDLIVAYGIWLLDKAKKSGAKDLFFVEGESDTLTLVLHGYAAVGLPGATHCKKVQTAHLRALTGSLSCVRTTRKRMPKAAVRLSKRE